MVSKDSADGVEEVRRCPRGHEYPAGAATCLACALFESPGCTSSTVPSSTTYDIPADDGWTYSVPSDDE